MQALSILGLAYTRSAQGVFTTLDSGGLLRKSWVTGSAVQIESGLYLTAMHLFSGPIVAGSDVLVKIPFDFRINGTESEADGVASRMCYSGWNIGDFRFLPRAATYTGKCIDWEFQLGGFLLFCITWRSLRSCFAIGTYSIYGPWDVRPCAFAVVPRFCYVTRQIAPRIPDEHQRVYRQ